MVTLLFTGFRCLLHLKITRNFPIACKQKQYSPQRTTKTLCFFLTLLCFAILPCQLLPQTWPFLILFKVLFPEVSDLRVASCCALGFDVGGHFFHPQSLPIFQLITQSVFLSQALSANNCTFEMQPQYLALTGCRVDLCQTQAEQTDPN